MKTLAGTLIEVKFIDMMIEIVKIVLVPIGAALLHDHLKRATAAQKKKVYVICAIAIAWLIMVVILQNNISDRSLQQSITLSGFFAGAIIVGVVYNFLHRVFQGLIILCH
jgi:BASS family bile acid:Na+ symporter